MAHRNRAAVAEERFTAERRLQQTHTMAVSGKFVDCSLHEFFAIFTAVSVADCVQLLSPSGSLSRGLDTCDTVDGEA
eukprot:SAG11_NODE_21278_length_428_cov_0.942249_1_plen_76_part_10